MTGEQLDSGDRRIILVLKAYNEKQKAEAEEKGDLEKVKKYQENIELYEKQLKKLSKKKREANND